MAANDYYNGANYNKPLPNPTPSPYGAYANTPQTSHSTPAPPYSSEPASGHVSNRPHQTTASPFESVFDDHVYPLDPQQSSNHHSDSSLNHGSGGMNQSGRYNSQPDTAYYGSGQQGRLSPDERRYTTEDIPLQNRPGAKDADAANDHVYDAGESGRSSRQNKKKGHVRLGQLGMFGSDKKRIPWVVYLFSIVQVAVFIGEIVRNGRRPNPASQGSGRLLTTS